MSTSSRTVVCVDIGSSSIKAALIQADGQVLSSSSILLPCRVQGNRCEMDTKELWNSFALAVQELTRFGVDLHAIDGFAVTSQMAGLILLGADYDPLGPAILGVDLRGADYTAKLDEMLGSSIIHERTGCPLSGIYPTGKLLSLATEEPDRVRTARYMGGIKEYVLWKLTGTWITDPASASVTQLYDQIAHNWWSEMITAIGIEHLSLPTIANPDTLSGSLLVDPAFELGIVPGIPVTVGTGDGPAANCSTGVIAPGDLCISFGTTTVIRYVTEHLQPILDSTYFRQHFCDKWFIAGLRMEGTGRIIASLLADAPLEKVSVQWPTPIDDNREPIYFNPFAISEEERFIGDTSVVSREEKLEAVLEGILFSLFNAMEPVWSDQRFHTIRPIGGGRSNRRWMKQIADFMQIPVVLTSGGDSTLGAAMLLYKAIGVYASLQEAAAMMVHIENVLEPATILPDYIRNRYNVYRTVMKGGRPS